MSGLLPAPPLYPRDHQLRILAERSLAALERANDWRLSPAAFRRALRAHRRAVRRYQCMMLRRRGHFEMARRYRAKSTEIDGN